MEWKILYLSWKPRVGKRSPEKATKNRGRPFWELRARSVWVTRQAYPSAHLRLTSAHLALARTQGEWKVSGGADFSFPASARPYICSASVSLPCSRYRIPRLWTVLRVEVW